jgi:hypothetical protein
MSVVMARSPWGSLNSCSVPMMLKMAVRTSAERTMGSLMRVATFHSEAPSRRPASCRSGGMACSAA